MRSYPLSLFQFVSRPNELGRDLMNEMDASFGKAQREPNQSQLTEIRPTKIVRFRECPNDSQTQTRYGTSKRMPTTGTD